MKILLTLPPGIHDLEIYRVVGAKVPPLGLAYIAAALEKAGYKVRVLDTASLEMGLDEWIREIKSWKPDIIGFSLLTPTTPRGYLAAKIVKEEVDPNIPIIAGGPHPSFMYSEALANGIDVVVIGEGEYTMLELANVIEKHGLDPDKLANVKGIAFRDRDDRVRVTPPRPYIRDLDKLPWPARHLLPMDKYTLLNKPVRVAHVLATRGCPYGCMFCVSSYFWGRMVRTRSPSDVASEIEYLIDKYKVKYVFFTDDELTINKRFVYALLREFDERGIDIEFSCGSRVDHVDRELLRELAKHGCTAIYFGVESADQNTLNRIGKRITIEQVVRAFNLAKNEGISTIGSFILGFPWEHIDDMKKTIEFAIKLDPNYAQFSVLTPYPGTPLFNYAKSYGLIEDWSWEHYTGIHPVMRGFYFTRKQLGRLLKYAYRKFYLRPKFVLREIGSNRFFGVIRVLAREFFAIIKELVSGRR
ncbi:MAG: radical SAM protein [Thermoprotei archaeon]